VPSRPALIAALVLGPAAGFGAVIGVDALVGDDGDSGRVTFGDRTAATSSSPPAQTSALVLRGTSLFTIRVPSDWDRREEDRGTLHRTVFTAPADADTYVLVDAVAGASSTPGGRAGAVRAKLGAAGVEMSGPTPVTLAGRDAVLLKMKRERALNDDYFLNDCGDGFAVLGAAPPGRMAKLRPIFRRVAASLKSRSCG
jgi:hypothetical protein